jgi:3-oxochol-4-en-24-oyl-CoA dehydrogenase
MNLRLSDARILLRDTLTRALQKDKTAARLREAERVGFDAASWRVFTDLGLPLLRVDEKSGGADLGLFDAILVTETMAENLALVPAIDVMTCARLLSVLASPLALSTLGRITDGAIVVLALCDARAAPEQLLAFGSVAEAVVFRSGADLFLQRLTARERKPNIGGSAMARIHLDREDAELLTTDRDGVGAYEAACEEWKLLNAASIVAMGRRALESAAAYACDRQAFGRPIGSYQGLAHPLADCSVELDGGSLLIRRTVEAIGRDRADAGAMVSMCVWWASDVGTRAAAKAMRVFGGYGMTMEYDAQVYFRRATAQSLLAGDPEEELQRIAERLWDGAMTHLPAAGELDITFEYGESARSTAENVQRVFQSHVTPDLQRWAFESGDGYDRELYQGLAKEGLLFPDWPKDLGRGGDAFDRAAVHDVFVQNKWPLVVVATTEMLGNMIIHFGSERAKREILPRLASGAAAGALCYSEPSCGSDVFAAKTRAVRDGEDWLINGQKIFTSQGHIADYGLLLARTGDGAKHASVTVFAVPLRQNGYSCNPMETVGDETTNTTFYDNVRVPDAYRLGGVNEGTKVLAAALQIEQGAAQHYSTALEEMLEAALQWARDAKRGGVPAMQIPGIRARLAAVATRIQILEVLSRRTVWAAAVGESHKHYGPSAKLFGSESWVRCSGDLMNMAAPDTLLQGFSPLGRIEKLYRRGLPSTIYAGASEIQRSLIAEAGLGLPRSRS